MGVILGQIGAVTEFRELRAVKRWSLYWVERVVEQVVVFIVGEESWAHPMRPKYARNPS